MITDEKLKELIDAAMVDVRLSGGFVNFDGDEFCVDCKGWDGESRRCDCGNRRVDWTVSDDDSYVYPEVW